MADDDTFFGTGEPRNDRTVLKPRPGMRSRSPSPAPQGVPPAAPAVGTLASVELSDSNPLTAAATSLLSLAGHLSMTASHQDPQGLFAHVVREIQAFENAARQAGASNEQVLTARYALCTLIDEVVLNTPWGSQSTWPQQTLLTMFHKEAWGGEKFFQILERILQQPAANLDLLELFYLCLAMGLKGQYRVREDGLSQVELIRSNAYQTLRNHRPVPEAELSPRWQGVEEIRSPLNKALPLWAAAAIGAGIALAIYAAFLWTLNRSSDPVAIELASLGQNLPPLVERTGYVAPQRTLELRDLLQGELAAGSLELTEQPGAQTLVLRALFRSGNAQVDSASAGLLRTVATALAQLPGQIIIAGHTDDV
ncbi:MAG: type IVB secretion system protein IcmH/DotU, partial [Pseudomonadota bacterium]